MILWALGAGIKRMGAVADVVPCLLETRLTRFAALLGPTTLESWGNRHASSHLHHIITTLPHFLAAPDARSWCAICLNRFGRRAMLAEAA